MIPKPLERYDTSLSKDTRAYMAKASGMARTGETSEIRVWRCILLKVLMWTMSSIEFFASFGCIRYNRQRGRDGIEAYILLYTMHLTYDMMDDHVEY